MLDVSQYFHEIQRPTIYKMGAPFYSASAERLLLGTVMVESGLEYVHQKGGGPALSLLQIEPATRDDLHRFLLEPRNEMEREAVEKACGVDIAWLDAQPEHFRDFVLTTNMAYAIALARIRYWWIPAPLPYFDDHDALARYWGVGYNTRSREKDIQRFIKLLNWARERL